MSSSGDEDFGNLLAAAVVVGGVALLTAAAVQATREKRRSDFQTDLQSVLGQKGWQVLATSLGLASERSHVWSLTLSDSLQRLLSTQVALPKGVEPYSREALKFIYEQVETA